MKKINVCSLCLCVLLFSSPSFGKASCEVWSDIHDEYLMLAQNGNKFAQFKMYSIANDVACPMEEITSEYHWLVKSAENGYLFAAHELGVFHSERHSKNYNFDLALYYFNQSSLQSFAPSLFGIGQLYLDMDNPNYIEAERFFKKAWEQGSTDAGHQIGFMSSHGIGVEVNYEKAYDWYVRASARGNVLSMYSLALMYVRGTYVSENHKMAEKLFMDAMNLGSVQATHGLATLYLSGNADVIDFDKGYFYLDKAASLGHQLAQKKLSFIFKGGIYDGNDVVVPKSGRLFNLLSGNEGLIDGL